jgi:hypothetical protein
MPWPERTRFQLSGHGSFVPDHPQRTQSPQSELDDARTYAIIGAAIDAASELPQGDPA